MPQLEAILKAKTAIVSTTEELAYPGYTHIRQARLIHAWAKKAKVAVLATGVNPGFAMDTLPIILTAACERVDRVTVTRIQDARLRRLPFQQKIGAGLTTEQFQRKAAQGAVRHVGMTESIAMIADALGWTIDRISDEVQPKLAKVTISSEFLAVDPGYVCGIVQDGVGYREDRAGDTAALRGVPRRAGPLRRGRDRRLAGAVDEDCRRHRWRHRDRVLGREFHSQGARRPAGPVHHARPAAPVVLSGEMRELNNWVIW